MRTRRRAAAVLAAALTGALTGGLVGGPAVASFLDPPVATSTFIADTLQPVTGLAAADGCLLTIRDITLTWTPTSSTYATGYEVYRKVGAGAFALHATVPGRLVSTYVDTPLSASTTYTYYVRTLYASWTKDSAQVSDTTQGALCL